MLVALSLLAAQQVTAVPTEERVGWHFKVRVPSGADLVCQSPVSDFHLYQVKIADGRTLVGMYAGNFPQDPFENRKPRSERIGGRPAKAVRWSESDGDYLAALIELQTADKSPQYLHVWYGGLSNADAVVAERIVASLQYVADDSDQVACESARPK